MRRHPALWPLGGQAHSIASPSAQPPPATPATQGDAIEAWIASGGRTFYPTGWDYEQGIPEPAGVQLVCYQYIPKGRAAWVKRLEIAPCAPPMLVDPWRGWGGYFNLFEPNTDPNASRVRAPAQAGLWTTPLAWEGYFSAVPSPAVRPAWRWSLTLWPGNLDNYRREQNIPAFDPIDPASWYLAPNEPVPASTYGGQEIPGQAIPGYIPHQRFQVVPGDALPLHVFVPEDTTVCLWVKWSQQPLSPVLAWGPMGPIQPWASGAYPGEALPELWPLLPSVGRMVGYMQAADRPDSQENAAFGWGG